MRRLLFLTLIPAVFAASNYVLSVEKAREQREASMRLPGSWLTVTGLVELHPGKNTYGSDPKCDIKLPTGPPHAGALNYTDGKVIHGNVLLEPDKNDDYLKVGSLGLWVIKRGNKMFVRIRDPRSPEMRNFKGLKWFPVKESYRITAQWISNPSTLRILNVINQVEDQPSPGYAAFTLEGKSLRLYPTVEGDHLFFVFKDLTAGKETYGAGRFLDTFAPEAGKVVLDFNIAYNPPCAFTKYATCPLPPKQNQLPVRIEAGEKTYALH